MRCPECVAEGERSVVRVLRTTTTANAPDMFYDEDGLSHIHDPNKTTTEYLCSREHKSFESTSAPRCPTITCDWPALR